MTEDLPDHSNYSVLKAEDEDGILHTVLLDPSGAIVSVMKGWHIDEWKPLAVDAQGRIQAILTDPEDVFGNPSYMGAAELAVRLGSIRLYEKRGETVYMDDFEDSTLKWEVSGDGANHSEVRSHAFAHSGNYSLKLTTGDAQYEYARADHYHSLPVYSRLGFEYSFILGSDLAWLYSKMYLYSTTKKYEAAMYYAPPSNDLKIETLSPPDVTIDADLDLKEYDNLFHTWKLVFDLESEKYVRAFVDENEYNLSAYGIKTTIGTYTPHMHLVVLAYNNAAGNHYTYIDDVIFTQNEP